MAACPLFTAMNTVLVYFIEFFDSIAIQGYSLILYMEDGFEDAP